MSTVRLDGAELDFSSALPLRVADWKALKTVGVTIKSLSVEDIDLDMLVKVVAHALRKAGHAVSDEKLENSLTVSELSAAMNAVLLAESAAVDRPT